MYFQDRLLAKIDKKIIDPILLKFGFDPEESFKALSGWDSLNIVAKTHKKEVILRFFRPAKKEEDILFIIEILTHLEQLGLPVGKSYRTANGQSLVRTRIGKLKISVSVRDYLVGEQKNKLSEEELFEAGKTLAKIHLALSSFHKPLFDARKKSLNIPKKAGILNRALNKKLKKVKNRDFKLLWFSFYPRFKKNLRQNHKVFASDSLLHGDFHQANLLFKEGQVSAVFDFDHAVRGPKIADIALFAVNYLIITRQSSRQAVFPGDVFSNFLKGYESVLKLTQGEHESLPQLTSFLFFEKMSWALSQKKKMGNYASDLLSWSKDALVELLSPSH